MVYPFVRGTNGASKNTKIKTKAQAEERRKMCALAWPIAMISENGSRLQQACFACKWRLGRSTDYIFNKKTSYMCAKCEAPLCLACFGPYHYPDDDCTGFNPANL